jgi:outer membrane protein assembly factor BamB
MLRMRIVFWLAVALFSFQAVPVPPIALIPLIPLIDDVLGAWQGTLEHNGETRDLIVEFTRVHDKVWLMVTTPAIHATFPVATVEMTGRRVTAGPVIFEFDPAAQTLVTTLPADLVPKDSFHVTFHRRTAPATLLERPPLDGPRREPAWTVDLHAPIWADVAVGDGLVVAGADDGRLHAVDAATGHERWAFKAGGAIRARAVFIEGDVVVQSDDGVLYRLDGRTGEPRWRVTIAPAARRVALDDPASRYENRASAAAAAGRRLFVGTHEGRLLALDARTGAIVWQFKAADAIIATPVVAAGRVYCGSFDGHVYALDGSSGALVWKHDTGGAVASAVAAGGSKILSGSRSFDFEALDAATGRAAWTKYFWFSWVESPATVAGSAAFVGSSDAGIVSSFDVATGRVRWTREVQGSAWGQPAVTDSTVYEGVAGVLHYIAPHRGSVVALDRASGKIRWWYSAHAPDPEPKGVVPYGFAGPVAVGKTLVFAGGLDGVLYAFPR